MEIDPNAVIRHSYAVGFVILILIGLFVERLNLMLTPPTCKECPHCKRIAHAKRVAQAKLQHEQDHNFHNFKCQDPTCEIGKNRDDRS